MLCPPPVSHIFSEPTRSQHHRSGAHSSPLGPTLTILQPLCPVSLAHARASCSRGIQTFKLDCVGPSSRSDLCSRLDPVLWNPVAFSHFLLWIWGLKPKPDAGQAVPLRLLLSPQLPAQHLRLQMFPHLAQTGSFSSLHLNVFRLFICSARPPPAPHSKQPAAPLLLLQPPCASQPHQC